MTLLNNVPDFNGRITTDLVWGDRCIVAWGGLRVGGAVTVHLPKELMWNGGGGMCATAACMPGAGMQATWTYRFGFTEWDGALLCRRCFAHKTQKPKATYKPENGWWAYIKTPKDETALHHFDDFRERRVRAVNKILALIRYDETINSDQDLSNRIVEV